MIGMLGGMSWESTVEYYRIANERVRDVLGGTHSARILLDSVDFAEIEALQAGGADFLVLCTNTMHIVIDAIQEAVDVPVLHIADATAAAIQRAAVTRIGLLGTAFTMEQSFYRDRLEAFGIQTLVPRAEDRRTVHRIIYDELVRGVVRDRSRGAYRDVIARLVDDGAEGIVLGCTEIELLVSPHDSPVPVFPTTRIHVEAAVDRALGRHPH